MLKILTASEVQAAGKLEPNAIVHGDCFDVLGYIEDGSVDLIATDLPYQITACKWDTMIPFAPMWAQVKRLLKKRGAFVTTASQPFTSMLVMSNLEWFADEWVWRKDRPSNVYQAHQHPLKYHESVIAFAGNGHTYNPQMGTRSSKNKRNNKPRINHSNHFGDVYLEHSRGADDSLFPSSVIEYNRPQDKIHPTQKPVSLYEYLIRTYTNEGDTVLDFCAGSFTTAVACVNTGRRFIAIEKEQSYFDIGVKRLQEAMAQTQMELA